VTPKLRIVAATVRIVKPRRLTKARRLRQQREATQWQRQAAKSVEPERK
jgi:hypothetical protein